MMKRIFMLLALALMVVAAMALSGVAQAASPSEMCREKAQSLTGSTLEGYTFVVGTADRNTFTSTDGRNAPAEVFCGFDGGDHVMYLKGSDIFIGGKGTDSVELFNSGRFYGGDGDDSVDGTNTGRFYGGAGGDSVHTNNGDFNGGDGYDSVDTNLVYGTFDGGYNDDHVKEMYSGTFDGGAGNDYVVHYYAGHLVNVP
jgi:hypothetical protein